MATGMDMDMDTGTDTMIRMRKQTTALLNGSGRDYSNNNLAVSIPKPAHFNN